MGRFSEFLILSSILLIVSADQLLILNAPKSIELKGESYLTPEAIEDVHSASLGYSVSNDETSSWDGLVINDPFNLAQGIVNVVVDGVESLSFKDAKAFDVLGSGDPLSAVAQNVIAHQGSKIDLDLKTNVADALNTPFGVISAAEARATEYLKPKSIKADDDFLKQISIIDGLTELFKNNLKDLPTATIVRASMTAFMKEHDASTPAYTEAFKILRSSISALEEATDKAFNGNALISILATAGTVHSRAKRDTETSPAASNNLGIVDGYDRNYPVIFNICLWFTIIMLLVLLAISLAIGGMDHGDSIIYRMTSTRMKKDN